MIDKIEVSRDMMQEWAMELVLSGLDGTPISDQIEALLYAPAAQPQGEIETLRAALRTEVEAGDSWRREALELRGLTPAFPPRPPDGEGMPRYGLRWNGPQQPLAVAMSDGYWTPWHLAERRVEVLEGLLREMTAGYRSREHFMKYAPWTNDNDLRERVADFAYPVNEGASHE